MRKQPDARVVESVDTRDLKSLAGNSVPVQVRPRAPFLIFNNIHPIRKLITNSQLPCETGEIGEMGKTVFKTAFSPLITLGIRFRLSL